MATPRDEIPRRARTPIHGVPVVQMPVQITEPIRVDSGDTFLGLTGGGWTRLLVPIMAGALVVLLAWALYGWTQAHAASPQDVDERVTEHEQRGEHPRLERHLESIDAKVDELRATQIRQTVILDAIHAQLEASQPRRHP